MVRMNIVLPEPLAEHLKTVPNKSRYIAEALEEKISRIRAEFLRQELAKAYKELAREDAELNKEWEVTIADGLDEK
jgi:hypothetical protein